MYTTEMKRVLTIFTFLFSFFTSAMVVNIGVENSWPPFADEHGEGISSEIVVRAFKEVGVEVKLHVYPYSRIMEMTKRGELDGCYNVSKDKSTNSDFIFGSEPIVETSVSYYHLKGTPYKEELSQGDKIALMRGYQYGDKYNNEKSDYVETRVNSQEQIIQLILRDRVDVGILTDENARLHIKRLGLEDKILKGATHSNLEVYLAFSKINVKSNELASLLDKGVRMLKEKGVYETIISEIKKGQESLAQSN